MPLPNQRRDRPWNTFDRWLRNHQLIRSLQRKIATVALYGVVRKVDRTKPRQHMQLTRGGKTGDGSDAFDSWEDCSFLEPQGFSAGVPIGARGLVLKPGSTPEFTCAVGVSKATQRPTFLESEETCQWTPFGSRVFANKNGEVRIETDLADYKGDPSDLDEGAKLRLKAGGVKGDADDPDGGGGQREGEEAIAGRGAPCSCAIVQRCCRLTARESVGCGTEDEPNVAGPRPRRCHRWLPVALQRRRRRETDKRNEADHHGLA